MLRLKVTSINELVREVRAIQSHPTMISIDGWMGAGKSTLGETLAAQLSIAHIDLDSFLIPDQKKFVEAIQIDSLVGALSGCTETVIVSGVCVLSVLENAGFKPDCRIYVKRMASWGWADEDQIYGKILEQVSENLGQPIAPVSLEVREYHIARRPEDNAHIVFLRSPVE